MCVWERGGGGGGGGFAVVFDTCAWVWDTVTHATNFGAIRPLALYPCTGSLHAQVAGAGPVPVQRAKKPTPGPMPVYKTQKKQT